MHNRDKLPTAILMCTCASYSKIAEATCKRIDQYWQNHPEIFIVGGEAIEGRQSIPFSCDEKDWVGMALNAVDWLSEKGFSHCYLILDDHPPVGICNHEFLNIILPKLSENVDASHIALAGWDQFQPKEGELISIESQQWMLNSISYKWKFDLHPGYWNLSHLAVILKSVMGVVPRIYSARSFESISGRTDLALPSRFLRATYKIPGDCNVVGNRWYQHQLKRRIVSYLLHAARLVTRAGGQTLLNGLDNKIEVYTQYINGPYPMYWSGAVKKGLLNRNLTKFAVLTGNKVLSNWFDSFDWPET